MQSSEIFSFRKVFTDYLTTKKGKVFAMKIIERYEKPTQSCCMRLIIFPALILMFLGVTFGQQHEMTTTNALDNDLKDLIVDNMQVEIQLFNDQLVVSTGFIDSEFTEYLNIVEGEVPEEINLTTSYLKPLQYTVSNVEGVILDRGRFIGEESLNFGRRTEGDYAVYIFAATKVVRAFMVSRSGEKVAVF